MLTLTREAAAADAAPPPASAPRHDRRGHDYRKPLGDQYEAIVGLVLTALHGDVDRTWAVFRRDFFPPEAEAAEAADAAEGREEVRREVRRQQQQQREQAAKAEVCLQRLAVLAAAPAPATEVAAAPAARTAAASADADGDGSAAAAAAAPAAATPAATPAPVFTTRSADEEASEVSCMEVEAAAAPQQRAAHGGKRPLEGEAEQPRLCKRCKRDVAACTCPTQTQVAPLPAPPPWPLLPSAPSASASASAADPQATSALALSALAPASRGGGQLDALAQMFPQCDRDVLASLLATCGGGVDKARSPDRHPSPHTLDADPDSPHLSPSLPINLSA